MDAIYRNATSTIIWLGSADKGSDIAMSVIRIGQRKDIEAHADSISKLADRPYWSRLWIIQELYMSRKRELKVRCGSQSAPYHSLNIMSVCAPVNSSRCSDFVA
jgi:hypothetical protein